MNRRFAVRYWVVAVALAAGTVMADLPGTFTAVAVTGMAKVQVGKDGPWEQIAVDRSYPFGSKVYVARQSGATVRLSPGNTIEFEAATVATLKAQGKGNSIGVTVELENGEVKVDLKADGKLQVQVQTLTGIATAKSSAFSVSQWLDPDKITHETSVAGMRGEVQFASGFAATHGDSIRAGGLFRFSCVTFPSKDYAFIPSIGVTGQDLRVALGKQNFILLTDGADASVAMVQVPGNAAFAGVDVNVGRILVGGVEWTEDDHAGFVRQETLLREEGGKAGKYQNAAGFMSTAQLLCERCSTLTGCSSCCMFYTDYAENLPAPAGPGKPRPQRQDQ